MTKHREMGEEDRDGAEGRTRRHMWVVVGWFSSSLREFFSPGTPIMSNKCTVKRRGGGGEGRGMGIAGN